MVSITELGVSRAWPQKLVLSLLCSLTTAVSQEGDPGFLFNSTGRNEGEQRRIHNTGGLMLKCHWMSCFPFKTRDIYRREVSPFHSVNNYWLIYYVQGPTLASVAFPFGDCSCALKKTTTYVMANRSPSSQERHSKTVESPNSLKAEKQASGFGISLTSEWYVTINRMLNLPEPHSPTPGPIKQENGCKVLRLRGKV